MKLLLVSAIPQVILLLLLLRKDKNDGEKELFKKQSWKALDAAIIVLAANFFSLIIHYLLKIKIVEEFSKPYPYVVDLVVLFCTLGVYESRVKQNLTYLGFSRKNLKKGVLWAIAVALTLYVIHEILIIWISPAPGILNQIRALKNSGSVYFYYNLVFLPVILGPLFEECVYRGILYSPYRKKYGPKIGIVLIALFFCITHVGSNPIYFFLSGILLGVLYEKTESIISTIVSHSAYNLFVLLSGLYLH